MRDVDGFERHLGAERGNQDDLETWRRAFLLRIELLPQFLDALRIDLSVFRFGDLHPIRPRAFGSANGS